MAAAAILNTQEMVISQQRYMTIAVKSGVVTHFEPLDPFDP